MMRKISNFCLFRRRDETSPDSWLRSESGAGLGCSWTLVWLKLWIIRPMCVFVHVHVSAHLESDVILARWNMLEYSEYPTGALGGRGWGNMSWLMRVLGYQNSLEERNSICYFTSEFRELEGVKADPNCCWRSEIKVWGTVAHTGGASTEHSWHYSLLTNNPNFIQWAGPTEWLQCVEFTHWGGQRPAQSSTLSLSKHYHVWGGAVISVSTIL